MIISAAMIRKAFNLEDDASLVVRLPSRGIFVPYEVTSITVCSSQKQEQPCKHGIWKKESCPRCEI